jgi:hypothetical protein
MSISYFYLIASVHATWDVEIHNHKIEGILGDIAKDGEEIYNSTSFQHYMHRM